MPAQRNTHQLNPPSASSHRPAQAQAARHLAAAECCTAPACTEQLAAQEQSSKQCRAVAPSKTTSSGQSHPQKSQVQGSRTLQKPPHRLQGSRTLKRTTRLGSRTHRKIPPAQQEAATQPPATLLTQHTGLGVPHTLVMHGHMPHDSRGGPSSSLGQRHTHHTPTLMITHTVVHTVTVPCDMHSAATVRRPGQQSHRTGHWQPGGSRYRECRGWGEGDTLDGWVVQGSGGHPTTRMQPTRTRALGEHIHTHTATSHTLSRTLLMQRAQGCRDV